MRHVDRYIHPHRFMHRTKNAWKLDRSCRVLCLHTRACGHCQFVPATCEELDSLLFAHYAQCPSIRTHALANRSVHNLTNVLMGRPRRGHWHFNKVTSRLETRQVMWVCIVNNLPLQGVVGTSLLASKSKMASWVTH